MFYETSKGSTRAENNISSQPTNNTYIELSDTNKTKMKKREHANIIRYHQFKFDTEMHEYIYSELLFFYPWQTETELYSDNFDSCWNLFNDYFETIQSNKTKLYPHTNNIQKAREFMNKNPTNAADLLLDPAFEQQNLDDAIFPRNLQKTLHIFLMNFWTAHNNKYLKKQNLNQLTYQILMKC
jgi:hypothetical protein